MAISKVVVRFKDGTLKKGSTNDFFPNKAIFHLSSATGEMLDIKIEELKAVEYDTVAEGEVTDSVTLENSSYKRSIVTKDLGSYKQVTVTISWGTSGNSVSLDTFIAPK